MGATSISSLSVQIGADIEPLKDGLKAAQSSVTGWAGSIGKSIKSTFSNRDMWKKAIEGGVHEGIKSLDDLINAAALAMGRSTGIAALLALPVQLILGAIETSLVFYRLAKSILTSLPIGIGKAFGYLFTAVEEIAKLPFKIAWGIASLYQEVMKLFAMSILMPGVFWSKVMIGTFKVLKTIISGIYNFITSIPAMLKSVVSVLFAGIKMIPKILSTIIGLVFDLGEALIKGAFSAIKGIYSLLTSNAVKSAVIGIGVGAAAIGTAMAYAAKKGMDFIVSITTMSDKLGLSVELMQQLDYAAKLANVSTEGVGTAVKNMLKNVSLAASGAGPAKDIFGEFGINPRALASMRPEEMLLTVADAIASIGNASDRTRISMAIFGRNASEILPLLAQGSAGLIAMANDAESVAGKFSRIDAEQVMQASNAIQRMQIAFGKTGKTLAILVAPYVEYVANAITDFGKNGVMSNGLVQQGLEIVGKAFAWILDTVQVFIEKIKTIPSMVNEISDTFTTLGKAIWAAVKYLLPKGAAVGGWIGGKAKGLFGGLIPEIKIPESNKWSNRAADFFKSIKDNSLNTATAFVQNMNMMDESVSDYTEMLEAAKNRAKEFSDQAKQQFAQGNISRFAINTPVSRALYNQALAGDRMKRMEVSGPVLDAIARGIYAMNAKLDTGITLKAGG